MVGTPATTYNVSHGVINVSITGESRNCLRLIHSPEQQWRILASTWWDNVIFWSFAGVESRSLNPCDMELIVDRSISGFSLILHSVISQTHRFEQNNGNLVRFSVNAPNYEVNVQTTTAGSITTGLRGIIAVSFVHISLLPSKWGDGWTPFPLSPPRISCLAIVPHHITTDYLTQSTLWCPTDTLWK